MKEKYCEIKFVKRHLELIATMDNIVREYQGQGFTLTVRQLYYQLVARAVIPNTEQSYKHITRTCNDARLAGLIDWDAIEDRTRAFSGRSHWSSGRAILDTVVSAFHMDMWENQRDRVFVVVEKEALVGVFEPACHALDVPLLAARGYPSASVLREFAKERLLNGQNIVIAHFGDHDPSGLDMTRDLQDRLDLFTYGTGPFLLNRIALNIDQVRQYNPPANPAKVTDSRFDAYQKAYGDLSWELDALDPAALDTLIREEVGQYIDADKWAARVEEIEAIRARLAKTAAEFDA